MRYRSAIFVSALLACAASASAQTQGTCIPVAERGDLELGCFITAQLDLGSLPRDRAWYWHLDTFVDRASAERERTARGIVVESLGYTWLFTIADSSWRAADGYRVATIGPLPIVDAQSLAAVYMQGVFEPGMATVVHRHPGVEAWHTLTGAMCLETSAGVEHRGAGESGPIVAAGLPMQLTGTGSELRRSVVLILQDATQPRSTPAHDWTPRGLCTR